MTDLIFHIGQAKSGSSSIQESLFDARSRLANAGILHHSPKRSGGHYSYLTLLGRQTRGDTDRARTMAEQNIGEIVDLQKTHNAKKCLSQWSLKSACPNGPVAPT